MAGVGSVDGGDVQDGSPGMPGGVGGGASGTEGERRRGGVVAESCQQILTNMIMVVAYAGLLGSQSKSEEETGDTDDTGEGFGKCVGRAAGVVERVSIMPPLLPYQDISRVKCLLMQHVWYSAMPYLLYESYHGMLFHTVYVSTSTVTYSINRLSLCAFFSSFFAAPVECCKKTTSVRANILLHFFRLTY